MGFIKDRRPIEFHQVCAIARVVLLQEPTLSDSEWKAATKEKAAKQGYDEPSAEMLSNALTQVEQALKQTLGIRPIAGHLLPPPAEPQKPDRSLTPAEWKAVANTVRAVVKRSAASMPANVVPIARETLTITEHAALDQFYQEAAGEDRIGALRRFVEIAIARDAGCDPETVRAESSNHRLFANVCFGCRRADRQPLIWHHVIQIQHGGSNLLRNRVALCDDCHADVHPWLPQLPRVLPGWSSLADIAPRALAWFKSRQEPGDVA